MHTVHGAPGAMVSGAPEASSFTRSGAAPIAGCALLSYGTSNPPHRHDAHVFLHLLEGQLIVQLKDAQPVTLNPGDTYYESPNDVHMVSRNPSDSVPAKALIFMVKKVGAPATTIVKD